MNIKTNVAIENGYYCKKIYDPINGVTKIIPLGKAATVEEILENIEDDSVEVNLSFEYQNRTKLCTIARDTLFDRSGLKLLAGKGVDVTSATYDSFVDSIRLQEKGREEAGAPVTSIYEKVGWIYLPAEYTNDDKVSRWALCYRGGKLLGEFNAKYIGPYDLSTNGKFAVWREMIQQEVIGRTAMELFLLAALASVLLGLISMETSLENPILHANYPSGRGKSTVADLCGSCFGPPSRGTRSLFDEDGAIIRKQGIIQSWSATDNAVISAQTGNRGVVTILDEFGKYSGTRLKDVLFNLSEGTDKLRLSSNLKARSLEGYSTVFLSMGESSLLERCKAKLGGLQIRVLEIDSPLTDDADHSRRIKAICKEHNGHAAPMLAQYIIDGGGSDFVRSIYDAWVQKLIAEFPPSPSGERFVEKYAALIMATAQIAGAALDIQFSEDALIEFFREHEATKGQERSIEAKSYETLLEIFRAEKAHFYQPMGGQPLSPCWGRIHYPNKVLNGTQVLTEEYLVRPQFLREKLKVNGFSNIKTCVAYWKKQGVLDYEDEIHDTKKRKIDPDSTVSERVYVLQVFEPVAETGIETATSKRNIKVLSLKKEA